VSTLVNLLFGLFISYIYLHEPQRDYYATSGISPPIKLDYMLTPNMSDHPLLDSDPPLDDKIREIPQ
jgi:intracellular multiplication protein IcmM